MCLLDHMNPNEQNEHKILQIESFSVLFGQGSMSFSLRLTFSLQIILSNWSLKLELYEWRLSFVNNVVESKQLLVFPFFLTFGQEVWNVHFIGKQKKSN